MFQPNQALHAYAGSLFGFPFHCAFPCWISIPSAPLADKFARIPKPVRRLFLAVFPAPFKRHVLQTVPRGSLFLVPPLGTP